METIKKQSMGRQKIEIKKIKKKTQLQVSFSKRRKGLFKKVAELSTLCGVSATVLVHSPGGKLFSFGNPSPEHVIKRYLGLTKVNDDRNCCSYDVLATRHEDAMEKLRVEEELKKKQKEEENEENEVFWWRRKNVDVMSLGELEELKNALEGLKKKISARRDQMDLEMIMELQDDNFLAVF